MDANTLTHGTLAEDHATELERVEETLNVLTHLTPVAA
jgi:hypothetical protein